MGGDDINGVWTYRRLQSAGHLTFNQPVFRLSGSRHVTRKHLDDRPAAGGRLDEGHWRQLAGPLAVTAKFVGFSRRRGHPLGRRSTVGHRALDAVIGVRIPTSQPASARLRRATARPARPATSAATSQGWSYTREARLAVARAQRERRRTLALSSTSPTLPDRKICNALSA